MSLKAFFVQFNCIHQFSNNSIGIIIYNVCNDIGDLAFSFRFLIRSMGGFRKLYREYHIIIFV